MVLLRDENDNLQHAILIFWLGLDFGTVAGTGRKAKNRRHHGTSNKCTIRCQHVREMYAALVIGDHKMQL